MFRVRRYRIVLLAAFLSVASLYYLVGVRHTSLPHVDRTKYLGFGHSAPKAPSAGGGTSPAPPNYSPEAPPALTNRPPPDPGVEPVLFPPVTEKESDEKIADDTLKLHTPAAAVPAETTTGEELLLNKPKEETGLKEISESQWDKNKVTTEGPKARWRPQKPRNPVPDDKLIKLPAGKPRALPKIQYDFKPETPSEKKTRLAIMVTIRAAFKNAWQGYVDFALPHDELLPLSKSFSDSFMGWGATLIDSLDTLWIMGLKDEFQMAVNATSKVDFKTSHRKEIPMFETVIRILGGLISAHDLSEEQYPVLLEKAVELADILMGAFDTPNRMPEMYYKWAPSYASQQHRAGTRVVAAELGSLSMEFTRLAQITGNQAYYDAIARVQNALEEWQMETDIPGLFPLTFDASGCKKVDQIKVQSFDENNSEKPVLLDSAQLKEEDLLSGETPAAEGPPQQGGPKTTPHAKRQAEDDDDDISRPKEPPARERDNEGKPEPFPDATPIIGLDVTPDEAEDDERYCQPQGLNYEPYAHKHRYSIGAQADSLYEYMPKMYRLLGGLSKQYQSMYVNAAKAVRDKILYRPMIKDEDRPILFPAVYEFDTTKRVESSRVKTIYEATHLGCFAGGMFGVAAKTFGIDSDITIAKQLTDGCVWAYESVLQAGIMPESSNLLHCEDPSSCPWDETKWHKALDPDLAERFSAVDTWNKEQQKLYKATGIHLVKDSKYDEGLAAPAKPQSTVFKDGIIKDVRNTTRNVSPVKRDPPMNPKPVEPSSDPDGEDDAPREQYGFTKKVAMPHDLYVKARILEERLPVGYTKIRDRSYLLRPEAIESVFVMWRMTGDDYWRKKGWEMFQAIQEATSTEAGNAALEDVTSKLGERTDKMESFWLAETLKYSYLLFSEPTLVSLDEYVFNTEAHPFLVPKS